jgi:hypothetical protein
MTAETYITPVSQSPGYCGPRCSITNKRYFTRESTILLRKENNRTAILQYDCCLRDLRLWSHLKSIRVCGREWILQSVAERGVFQKCCVTVAKLARFHNKKS